MVDRQAPYRGGDINIDVRARHLVRCGRSGTLLGVNRLAALPSGEARP